MVPRLADTSTSLVCWSMALAAPTSSCRAIWMVIQLGEQGNKSAHAADQHQKQGAQQDRPVGPPVRLLRYHSAFSWVWAHTFASLPPWPLVRTGALDTAGGRKKIPFLTPSSLEGRRRQPVLYCMGVCKAVYGLVLLWKYSTTSAPDRSSGSPTRPAGRPAGSSPVVDRRSRCPARTGPRRMIWLIGA